jgi:uncharacterized protein YkwD
MSNLSSMKMLFLFFTFLPLFSCSKSEVPDTDVLQPIPDIIINNVNKSVMLNLINNVRASGCTCGTTKMPAVPKLEWNDTLSKAAYLHSVDMKTNSYFSHTGLDGRQPWDRLTSLGFKWTATGENIAQGQQSETLVMEAWLRSEGHCMNIMDARFRFMGAGMKDLYWTQVFAR